MCSVPVSSLLHPQVPEYIWLLRRALRKAGGKDEKANKADRAPIPKAESLSEPRISTAGSFKSSEQRKMKSQEEASGATSKGPVKKR